VLAQKEMRNKGTLLGSKSDRAIWGFSQEAHEPDPGFSRFYQTTSKVQLAKYEI
jgi:hypothetical protein